MANTADLEKIREIDRGIESAKRFESDLLKSGKFSAEEQQALLSVGNQEFIQLLESRGFKDTKGFIQARQDYSQYRFAEPSQAPNQGPEKAEKKGMSPADAAGALLGLGLTPFMRERGLTPELFETLSRNYAEKAAIEWNKTRDLSKARSYLHAYEIAQQDYFDRFAYSDPKRAKQLANFRTQKLIDEAILRNKLLKEKGIKGFAGRSWTPNYEQSAQNRLKMIDKLSEMRAKQLSGGDPKKAIPYNIALDRAREKLLRNFADDDPATFQHHINNQREQGKTLDPVMQRVIAEKIRDEQRLAERNKLSQKKREERQQTAPVPTNRPAKKPGRISRIKGRAASSKLGQKIQSSRLGRAFSAPSRFKNRIKQRLASSRLGRLGKRLNNLRPGNIAGRLRKKLKNSILNLLTKLLKRSLIGAVISAISSLISAAIAFAITIGAAIAAILATILSLLTSAIVALLSVTIATLASILATVIAVSLFMVVVFTVLSVLQQYFPDPAPGISYGIWGPERIKNGELIENRVGFFYFSNASCSIDDIILVDTLPNASTFVSATGNFEKRVDPNTPGGSIRWTIKENTPTLPRVGNGADQYVFRVVHKPQDNITATSKISMEGCKLPVKLFSCAYEENNLSCGEDDPPSELTCSGGEFSGSEQVPKVEEYDYNQVLFDLKEKLKVSAVNFGDPKCSITKDKTIGDKFTKGKLERLIEEKEPVVENQGLWMKIADCQSGTMGPNAYFPGQNEWGLFGMRRSKGKNNFFDQTDPDNPEKGDVPWQKQVQNAIAYNNANRGTFEFWKTDRIIKCLNEKGITLN